MCLDMMHCQVPAFWILTDASCRQASNPMGPVLDLKLLTTSDSEAVALYHVFVLVLASMKSALVLVVVSLQL